MDCCIVANPAPLPSGSYAWEGVNYACWARARNRERLILQVKREALAKAKESVSLLTKSNDKETPRLLLWPYGFSRLYQDW